MHGPIAEVAPPVEEQHRRSHARYDTIGFIDDLLWTFMFPEPDAVLECLVEETFAPESSIAIVGAELVRRVANASARTWVAHLEGEGPTLAVTRLPADPARIEQWLDVARRAIAAPVPKDDGRRGRDGTRFTIRVRASGTLVYATSEHDDASERDVLARSLVDALVSYTGGRSGC